MFSVRLSQNLSDNEAMFQKSILPTSARDVAISVLHLFDLQMSSRQFVLCAGDKYGSGASSLWDLWVLLQSSGGKLGD